MKQALKKTALAVACAGGMVATMQAEAANWLMLQGTERSSAAGRAKVWGFIQAQYQNDNSDPFEHPVNGDVYVPPKLIGPNLDDQSGFNVNRARIGVRGTGMAIDPNVNYFILAEFGNNAITHDNNSAASVTDASITLNHIKGARVRVGLFKTPGFEEGLQAIHVFDYINFTSVGNQLMLERFVSSSDGNQGASPIPNADMNQFSRPVGAFRDVGIQVFDAFKTGGWETSYALMVGNGNGLNAGDNDDNKDAYVYLSTEKVFGGKGPRREGLKLFAWHQSGKRTNAYDVTEEEDRKRTGVGAKYLKKPFRATAEYLKGEGMIFQGAHRPVHAFNDNDAYGYYVEGGWYIPNSKFEIDLRYDYYNRDENFFHPVAPNSVDGDETEYTTITLGAQYHINRKTRVNMEYASRDFESDTGTVDAQLEDVDGRFAIQLTHIF